MRYFTFTVVRIKIAQWLLPMLLILGTYYELLRTLFSWILVNSIFILLDIVGNIFVLMVQLSGGNK